MVQVGRRIIYDATNGKIVTTLGEMQGNVLPREKISELGHLDLEYGALADKFRQCKSYSIDTSKETIDANAIVFNFTAPDASLDEVKTAQKKIIDQDCQSAIIGGFHSTAYQNKDKIYDSTLEDQSNITGNALSAMSKLAGTPGCENDKFYYHARGEEFVEWQASECLQLARDFKVFKEQQLIKNKQLQAYVDTLETVEEVQKITWDTVIPT